MPSFKKKLTDEQRWQLVLYVRALAAGPGTPQTNSPSKSN
jgi:mono/diheme cytochrome c family protein